MNICTEFNFGDKVYHISQGRERIEWDCPVCKGEGRVYLDKSGNFQSYICPECAGRKHMSEFRPMAWMITMSGTVGCIDLKLYEEGSLQKNERKYMLCESGIGSGSLYHEDNLFRTAEEALAECEVRNKAKP